MPHTHLPYEASQIFRNPGIYATVKMELPLENGINLQQWNFTEKAILH